MKLKFLVFKAVTAFFLIAVTPPQPMAANPKPEPPQRLLAPQDSEAAKRSYFTDLKLITHEGKEVRFYTDILKDKVVLIHFFYTNCKTVAALQSKVLSDMQSLIGDRLGKDIFLVSITVDPERDTPDKVREYAKVFAARKGWIFLTGKKGNVDWINYKLGNYTEKPEDHAALLLLGNLKTGHWLKASPDARAKTLAEMLLKLSEEEKGVR